MLVTLGVVYGDIGTSPMYVTKALLAGQGGIMTVTEEFILGAPLARHLDGDPAHHREVRPHLAESRQPRRGRHLRPLQHRAQVRQWLIIPAMLGGAALLADGVLTPAVTITTAIEGLRTIPAVHHIIGDNQMNVVIITLVIVCLLFAVQRAGTSKIGRAFGPVMTFWFLVPSAAPASSTSWTTPSSSQPSTTLRGIAFLLSPNNHAGIMILGSCFLATTGAEAPYSDLGHVGRGNIYATWPFVKVCLILSYLGQGAWLLANAGNADLLAIEDLNPFFQMLLEMVRPFGVLPLHLRRHHRQPGARHRRVLARVRGEPPRPHAAHADLLPCRDQGPALIPMVNNVMWVGCVIVVLLFQSPRTWRPLTASPSPSR